MMKTIDPVFIQRMSNNKIEMVLTERMYALMLIQAGEKIKVMEIEKDLVVLPEEKY